MLFEAVRKAILYLKDTQEIGLFIAMADSRLFLAFASSPLYFIILPMLGLFHTSLALINGYNLLKASNKNWDKWSGFIVSAICALLASGSLYGAVIATAMGVTFAAGPWLFFSSVLLAFTHQVASLVITLYRLFESEQDSRLYRHYLQAAVNTVFNLSLLTAVAGTVLFGMLLPIAPLVTTVFACTTVFLSTFNLLWRLLPYNWKQEIKTGLNIGKPDELPRTILLSPVEVMEVTSLSLSNSQHTRLFSSCDYSRQVKAMDFATGFNYIELIITRKLALLRSTAAGCSDKISDKIAILTAISQALSSCTVIDKEAMLMQYPLAFQSFWLEKGDVEQIVDAAVVLSRISNTRTYPPAFPSSLSFASFQQ